MNSQDLAENLTPKELAEALREKLREADPFIAALSHHGYDTEVMVHTIHHHNDLPSERTLGAVITKSEEL